MTNNIKVGDLVCLSEKECQRPLEYMIVKPDDVGLVINICEEFFGDGNITDYEILWVKYGKITKFCHSTVKKKKKSSPKTSQNKGKKK